MSTSDNEQDPSDPLPRRIRRAHWDPKVIREATSGDTPSSHDEPGGAARGSKSEQDASED